MQDTIHESVADTGEAWFTSSQDTLRDKVLVMFQEKVGTSNGDTTKHVCANILSKVAEIL